MKVKDFVDLVNSMDCEEFSDIPEKDVELVKSRVDETWSLDDLYSTSMNVYKCEDGYAGVIGVCHYNQWYFEYFPELLIKLPHCIAVEVSEVNVPSFIPKPNVVYLKLAEKMSKPIKVS